MHWRQTDKSALGSVGTSQIEVFPQAPEQAAIMRLPAVSDVWELAQITAHPPHASQPEEVYSRQGDLIARYQQTEQDTFAYQLDWQLLAPQGPFVAGVELWLSIQTDLLNTRPQLEVTTQALHGNSWRILQHCEMMEDQDESEVGRGPAALVCEARSGDRTSHGLTGVWLIAPGDQRHTRLQTNDSQSTQSVRLFGHFMEKGVIRRARMRFLLAAQTITNQHIASAYCDLAESPLPLTA